MTGSVQSVADRVDVTRRFRSGTRLLARFGVVGLLAFVVDVSVFNLLRYGVELGPLSSKTLSVAVATSVAFLGNLRWTFGERHGRNVMSAYVLFFVSNGIGLVIALGCLAVSTYVLGLTSPLAENIASNVVGLGLGTLFRFWAYHRWVFRDFDAEGDQPARPAHDLRPTANPPEERRHAC